MRHIYTLFFYLALPLIVARLLWRARKVPGYAQRWNERFGYFKAPVLQDPIWLHAVSVGEVIAAIPLIKQLKIHYPHRSIVVTTMTPTGSARVQAALGDHVFHVYAPYDLPFAIHNFLHRIKPNLLIVMETELWPNLFHSCAKQRIPICIANARLSELSLRGYRYVATAIKKVLAHITLLIAQTQVDAERFIALGMDPARVRVTGSIKFDLQIPDELLVDAAHLRKQWDCARPMWIAASTHQGEEEIILAAFAKVRAALPQALLILVPRHPDRFHQVTALCRKQGYRTVLRSSGVAVTASDDIFIGDTIGELLLFYAIADIAFVGGSLVPTGGHNLLEPSALGVPTLTGPHMFNFVEINHLLQTAGAVFPVQNADQLAQRVVALLQDPAQYAEIGQRARAVIANNKGALKSHLELIQTLLSAVMPA